jgi:hypothetical protein
MYGTYIVWYQYIVVKLFLKDLKRLIPYHKRTLMNDSLLPRDIVLLEYVFLLKFVLIFTLLNLDTLGRFFKTQKIVQCCQNAIITLNK